MKEKNERDFSAETSVTRSKALRIMLVIIGTVSFVLGIIGIFLPVLPTTPFLLLSAACYARGSVRFYNWLMNNRIFGQYIHDWRTRQCIPLRTKIFAISLILITIGSSVVFFIPILAVKIGVSAVGLAVTVYLIQIKTCEAEKNQTGD